MVNDSIDNIRLDISRHNNNAAIYIRENDTKTRTVHCTLSSGGKIVPLDNVIVAEILIKRADGGEADNSVVIVNNELQYTWRTSDLASNGENRCQFMVTFDDGSTITSPEFSLFVYKKVINQSTQKSMNEYTAIADQVVQARNYANDAENSATMANTAFENASDVLENVQTIADNVQDDAEKVSEAVATCNENVERAETVLVECNRVLNETSTIVADAEQSRIESKENADRAETMANEATGTINVVRGYSVSASTAAESAEEYAVSAVSSKNVAVESATVARTSENNSRGYEAGAKSWYDRTYEIYEKIGEGTLVLGETQATAYRGDRGKIAYDHSNTNGNPHNTTYNDVGADAEGSAAAAYAQAAGYTDKKIADLINGAPETLDTLKEIADAMASQKSVVDALDQAIGTKANETDFSAHANNETIHIVATEREKWDQASTDFVAHALDTDIHVSDSEKESWNSAKAQVDSLPEVAKTGNYSDLFGKPTIPTKTSDLTNDSGFKTTDTNTTYTFATGDNNGQIKVTPSGGTAQNVSVKGLGSLAYSSATIPTNTNQLTNGAGFITSSGTASNVSGTVAIAHGGTGATTAANARTNLGLGGAATYGATTSVTNGGTSLVTSGGVYTAINGIVKRKTETLQADANGLARTTLAKTKKIIGGVITTYGYVCVPISYDGESNWVFVCMTFSGSSLVKAASIKSSFTYDYID